MGAILRSQRYLALRPFAVVEIRGRFPSSDVGIVAELVGESSGPVECDQVRASASAIVALVPTGDSNAAERTLRLTLVQGGRRQDCVEIRLAAQPLDTALVEQQCRELIGWPGDTVLTRAYRALLTEGDPADALESSRRILRRLRELLERQVALGETTPDSGLARRWAAARQVVERLAGETERRIDAHVRAKER